MLRCSKLRPLYLDLGLGTGRGDVTAPGCGWNLWDARREGGAPGFDFCLLKWGAVKKLAVKFSK